MKKIPQIAFNRRTHKGVSGFELIDLPGLFQSGLPEDHDPYAFHRLEFFAILINLEGDLVHKVDFQQFEVQEGDALLIASGQIHAFDPKASNRGFLVVFTGAFMNRYLAKETLSHINQLYNFHRRAEPIQAPGLHTSFLKDLDLALQKENETTRACLIGAALTRYLVLLKERETDSLTEVLPQEDLLLFENFRQLLQDNYQLTRNAADYADRLFVSYRRLNQACKRVVKQTAKQFIDFYLLLEAKRLIVSTGLSFKEISFHLGFKEPTNFIKYFKKHTQRTPANFRAQYK
ncbi:MAG: helix-turn-helix domain-containing protein [Saprospiraceae bacterium]|nr:helix-turn-helix domain-containing protein [Saprospiraceae bacterium]